MTGLKKLLGAVVAASVLMVAHAAAQEVKHYRFAYDQPKTTGYGILADIFADKLKEVSKGTMIIDQYPGAQLGQEPQVLQLVKAGDVEFCISSSANAATLSPQAGVMSMHFLFRSEAHLVKAMADPEVAQAVKAMISETVQGARVIALATLGLRSMYSKREIKSIADIKGLKVRVQATPTEDVTFPAYGAQIVHMPFGSVYTSLQTGVVDVGENGARAVDDRARGQQLPGLGQRQALEQPDGRAAGLGAGRGRRGQPHPAGQGHRARAPVAGQAQIHGGEGRRRRRQIGLHRGRRPPAGQARQGARAPRGEGQEPGSGD